MAPSPGLPRIPVRSARPASAGLRLETVRVLGPRLEAQVQAVARAAAAADGGVLPFGEHKWLRLVRGDDRCTALLLWRERDLVGAAHCDAYHTTAPDRPCRLTAEMVVHPDHRQHGLGSLLLQAVMALAREEGAGEVHVWAYGNLPQARRIAERIGCREERVLLQMFVDEGRLPTAAPLPEGIHLRRFEPRRDAYAWLALHNRVFSGHPEQGSWDAGDLQTRLEQPWFNPADLLLAEDEAHRLVGFCWVKLPLDPQAPGEIYIVGVDRDQRGRGLGRALTEAGLAHIRASGRRSAMLFVEAQNEAAIALYRGLGFEERWRHVCYARAVRPTTGGDEAARDLSVAG